MHEAIVHHGQHLAPLVRHDEADDDEVHAPRTPGLLVDLVEGRADLDRVARADRDPELDVLAGVEAGADVDRLRDALGVEAITLVADAEGGVTDQARARLGEADAPVELVRVARAQCPDPESMWHSHRDDQTQADSPGSARADRDPRGPRVSGGQGGNKSLGAVLTPLRADAAGSPPAG